MDLLQREINLLNAEKKITSEKLSIQNQKLANSLLTGSLGKDINQTFSKKESKWSKTFKKIKIVLGIE
jgi:hypothetical protein